jgi:protease I
MERARRAPLPGRGLKGDEGLDVEQVLLVIGDAAEVFDTLYPLHRIREDGYRVVVAGPARRVYHLVMHDAHPDWDITVESPGYKLAADIAFRDIKPEEYSGIVLSGGRAPEYLRYDADLVRVVRSFFERSRPVASICHGIEILAAAGVIAGKTVTTVRKCRFDAEVCGATFVDEEVVVSDNLVTARTWHDNHAFMREFMKLLKRSRRLPETANVFETSNTPEQPI